MRVIAWCVVLGMLLLLVGGCGSGGSGLNGSLSMSVSSAALPGTGLYQISATSTYTNPTQTNLIGTPITFHVQYTDNTGGNSASYSQTVYTNNSGGVTYFVNVPQSWGSTTLVRVWSSTGSLNGVDKDIILPQIQPLSVTPPVFSFASSAVAGVAQVTGTINGGIGAFYIYSTVYNSGKDGCYNVSLTDGTLTATKMQNGPAGGYFRIRDGINQSKTVTVPVVIK